MSGPLEITLKDKFLFIERLLIPSFDLDNALDTSKKRKEWMGHEANNTGWDTSISAELIKIYGTVKSFEEAEKKLEKVKAERLLEKAEENERKLGKSNIICSHSSFFTLSLSFPVYCHLVSLHVVNLCCFLPLLFFAIFLFYRPNSSR